MTHFPQKASTTVGRKHRVSPLVLLDEQQNDSPKECCEKEEEDGGRIQNIDETSDDIPLRARMHLYQNLDGGGHASYSKPPPAPPPRLVGQQAKPVRTHIPHRTCNGTNSNGQACVIVFTKECEVGKPKSNKLIFTIIKVLFFAIFFASKS